MPVVPPRYLSCNIVFRRLSVRLCGLFPQSRFFCSVRHFPPVPYTDTSDGKNACSGLSMGVCVGIRFSLCLFLVAIRQGLVARWKPASGKPELRPHGALQAYPQGIRHGLIKIFIKPFASQRHPSVVEHGESFLKRGRLPVRKRDGFPYPFIPPYGKSMLFMLSSAK